MTTINFPVFNIPKIPSVNNINIDICTMTSNLINTNIVPPLNKSTRVIIDSVNNSSQTIHDGIITAMNSIDKAAEYSMNGLNTSVNIINDSIKKINKIIIFLQSLIKTDTLLNTIRTIISLIILATIPPSEIPNVSFYTNFTIYLFIFIFLICPILSIVLLFL